MPASLDEPLSNADGMSFPRAPIGQATARRGWLRAISKRCLATNAGAQTAAPPLTIPHMIKCRGTHSFDTDQTSAGIWRKIWRQKWPDSDSQARTAVPRCAGKGVVYGLRARPKIARRMRSAVSRSMPRCNTRMSLRVFGAGNASSVFLISKANSVSPSTTTRRSK